MNDNETEIVFDSNLEIHRLNPYPDYQSSEQYYSDDRFYTEHSSAKWLEMEQSDFHKGWKNAYYDYLISLILKYSPDKNYRFYPPNLLDFGCASGYFLDRYYQKTGKIAFGIEPSELARDIGLVKGTSHIFESLEKFREKYPTRRFDTISLMLVLEHIPYPVEFLMKMYDNLNDNGRIVIVVPNEFNPLQSILANKYGYTPKADVHVNYFIPATLSDVMNEAGFRVIHKSATFPIEAFQVLKLIEYVVKPGKGQLAYETKVKFEKLLGVNSYRIYKWLFGKWGIGREMIFVGVKE